METLVSGEQAVLEQELLEAVRAKSPSELRNAALPRLSACAAAFWPGDLLEGYRRLFDDAIAAIPSSQHRDAAAALFALTDDRWTGLTERQRRAASEFGVAFDTFRRRRSGRLSPYQETIAELVAALVAVAPEGAATVVSEFDAGEPDPPDTPRRARRRIGVAVALLVPAVVGVAIVLAGRGESDGEGSERAAVSASSTTATTDPDCRDVGAVSPSAPTRVRETAGAFEDAYAEAGGPALGCPLDLAHAYGPMTVQELTRGGNPAGAIVGVDPAKVFLFTRSQWGSYHQIGGKSGDNAPSIGGVPTSVVVREGVSIIELSSGALLVGADPDAPHFWLPEVSATRWRETGEEGGSLGLPMSNAQVLGNVFRQDFERGYVALGGDGTISVELVDDPVSELPVPADDLAGKIVRQSDATAWFVTPEGLRRWIPDGGVWDCLGGWEVVGANDVPGYAAATFRYDGLATCDDAPDSDGA